MLTSATPSTGVSSSCACYTLGSSSTLPIILGRAALLLAAASLLMITICAGAIWLASAASSSDYSYLFSSWACINCWSVPLMSIFRRFRFCGTGLELCFSKCIVRPFDSAFTLNQSLWSGRPNVTYTKWKAPRWELATSHPTLRWPLWLWRQLRRSSAARLHAWLFAPHISGDMCSERWRNTRGLELGP